MSLAELRERHPRFIYESFQLDQQDRQLRAQFNFRLEPNVVFKPEVVIPVNRSLEDSEIDNLVFHLGLIEMISYWKAACPQEVLIDAGQLTDQQVAWWHDLFIHGLGEFFYTNNIDFTSDDFINFSFNPTRSFAPNTVPQPGLEGDLILVGGGKDSAVTLEILRETDHRRRALILNPTRAAIDSARIAGYDNPIIVKRTIDPKLLELNQRGYLNGHTPFSAYLAFLGVFVGIVHEYKNIIVSNERSAGEGNITFHRLEVNHQYSKSYRFEKLFREYCRQYLNGDIQYFSFLRPLYDLQISAIFATYSDHHLSFRSCNVNQKEDSWCGACSKCAFVYMSLFPFLPYERTMQIFSEDYFLKPEMEQHIRQLLGLGKHKPFECVGTIEESILAVALSIQKYRSLKMPVPPLLLSLEGELGIHDGRTIKMLEERVTNKWSNKNFLPPDYVALLKDAIRRARPE